MHKCTQLLSRGLTGISFEQSYITVSNAAASPDCVWYSHLLNKKDAIGLECVKILIILLFLA